MGGVPVSALITMSKSAGSTFEESKSAQLSGANNGDSASSFSEVLSNQTSHSAHLGTTESKGSKKQSQEGAPATSVEEAQSGSHHQKPRKDSKEKSVSQNLTGSAIAVPAPPSPSGAKSVTRKDSTAETVVPSVDEKSAPLNGSPQHLEPNGEKASKGVSPKVSAESSPETNSPSGKVAGSSNQDRGVTGKASSKDKSPAQQPAQPPTSTTSPHGPDGILKTGTSAGNRAQHPLSFRPVVALDQPNSKSPKVGTDQMTNESGLGQVQGIGAGHSTKKSPSTAPSIAPLGPRAQTISTPANPLQALSNLGKPLDTAAISQSIMHAISTGDGTHTVLVAMHPAELGQLHAVVSLVNNELSVLITAQTQPGHAALANAVGVLRSQLAQGGMNVNVTLRDPGSQRGRDSGEFQRDSRRSSPIVDGGLAPTLPVASRPSSAGQIDLVL